MFNELLKNVMNLGIITEDDVKRLTTVELMLLIIERTNGLLESLKSYIGSNDARIEELIKKLKEIERCIDNQLIEIAIETLNEWLTNGTLGTVINQSVNKTYQLSNLFKYKYMALTFTATTVDDPNTFLKIILSNDGINWVEHPLAYQSPSLRDPIMFQKGNKFYITGTNLITKTEVKYLVTEDFLDFEEVFAGSSNLTDYQLIWAPDVFKVGQDYYMTASLSRDEIPGLNIYVTKLDSNLCPTLWSKIGDGEIPPWCYDGHFIRTKDKYYLVLKDSSEVKGIRVYESTQLLNGYKRLTHLDYDDKQEAPYLMKLEDGTLRLYTDNYEGEGQISFKDSVDGGMNWTSLKPITIDTGLKAKHLHVYDIGGYDNSYHFTLNPNITLLSSIDERVAYEKRLFGESTRGTFPDILGTHDRWGYVTNIATGGGNFIQTMTTLSKRQFIRNCINGVWGEWSVILDSNDGIDFEADIPLSKTYVESGFCRLNALSTLYRRKQVGIQANFKLKTGTSGLITIGTIPDGYRSRTWVIGEAFASQNIDENKIKYELLPTGELNLMISEHATITLDMDFTININYITN